MAGGTKRLPRAVREQQMLDAAVQEFSVNGYHETSMDAIAAREHAFDVVGVGDAESCVGLFLLQVVVASRQTKSALFQRECMAIRMVGILRDAGVDNGGVADAAHAAGDFAPVGHVQDVRQFGQQHADAQRIAPCGVHVAGVHVGDLLRRRMDRGDLLYVGQLGGSLLCHSWFHRGPRPFAPFPGTQITSPRKAPPS